MNNKKPLWEQPWSYRESFLIAFEILLIGFIIEIISKGKGLSPISWPINLIGGLLFLSLILITHIFFRKRCFIKFLSGVPAAISSITIFCFLTLLLGFIPQNAEQTTRFIDIMGLTHLQHSYPFLFSALYLLFILGLTTLRRLSSINLKNTAFFLNHAGLWITLFAFALGSGDLLQLKVKLFENYPAKGMAVDQKMNIHPLPFTVQLLDFNIEEYPPKIALIETPTKKIFQEATNNLTLIKKGLKLTISGWDIEVQEYFENSTLQDSSFIESDLFGSAPSALISAKNNKGDSINGWVSPGSINIPFQHLILNEQYSIALTKPDPKKYSSLIALKTTDSQFTDTVTVEVNKPYSYKRWNIYQLSYEVRMGKWSPLSILEFVYDPWLPVIYTGLFMLLAGAVFMIWIGKDK